MSDRSVHTDALATLGTILQGEQGRDAIHIAVDPAIAAHTLTPGQHVGFLEDGTVGATGAGKLLGIVDPFLANPVAKGDKFWLLVYPRTITSLRHVWEHPSFVQKISDAEAAKAKILAICADLGCRYDELMTSTRQWLQYEDYWVDGGRWEGIALPEEFWPLYETVTGETVEASKKYSFFSCAC